MNFAKNPGVGGMPARLTIDKINTTKCKPESNLIFLRSLKPDIGKLSFSLRVKFSMRNIALIDNA